MRIFNLDISLKRDEKNVAVSPPQSETVYSESSLYGNGDFKRYNPDDLIGRKGYDIYKRMMKSDEQVKAAVRFRRNSATARDWDFKFDDDVELSETEQQLRINVFKKAIKTMPGKFTDALNAIMTSMQYGFSMNEKTFKSFDFKGKPYWGIKSISLKPFETFIFNTTAMGELKNVTQEIDGKNLRIDIKRMIHHVHNSDVDKFYGQSELREAYRSYWSKDVLIKLENIFLERAAGGLVWVEPTGSATAPKGSQTHTDITNILNTIQTRTGIMLPKDFKLNFESPKDTQAFDRATRKHDRGIAKALLMPNLIGLSDQGDTGSYSQSQTQLEAYLWMLDAEAADLAETLNEQLFSQIGDYNFGDGIYPEFYFKPLSKAILKVVTDMWKELANAGAVEPSDSDEEYLRELLEFPKKGEPISKPAEEPDLGTGNDAGKPDASPDDDTKPDVDSPSSEQPKKIEESVIGSNGTNIEYELFSRAQSRVDFVAIDRSTNIVEYQGINEFSATMQDIVEHAANEIATTPELITDPEQVKKFKLRADLKASLKKTAKRVLSSGWHIGINNAKQELEKSGKQQMSAKEFNKEYAAITVDRAADFFEAKAFTIAGKLNEDSVSIIRNILFNGIKFSKTTEQVIEDIYRAFATAGMLERDVVEDMLGEALNVKNPTHRLDTIVRTNTFEAINEARFSLFTSPQMQGFVDKLQYSAILDNRTTDICKALDNKVLLVTADEWDSLRPPNHMNCRSLLVAVTVIDNEKVTGVPKKVQTGSIAPAEGFA